VVGAVEGVRCEMIVDTGSNITVVRPDVLRRVAKDVVLDVHTVDSCLKTVTGETTAVRSRGRVNLQVGNFQTVHDVWVAEIENECILGLDFLIPNNCVVNVAEACLHIGSEEVRLKRMAASKRPVCRRVVVAENWSVPPKSEAIIPGVLDRDGGPEEGWGELIPSQKHGLPKDMLVARAVVDLGKPVVAVRVLNMSDEERVVRKGTDVASCEVIDSLTNAEKLEGEMQAESTVVDGELKGMVKELYSRSSDGLDGRQKEKLHALLVEFEDVFSTGPADMGRTSLTSHKIDTGSQRPIKQQPRRLPYSKLETAQNAIKEMHEQGVIEPSISPWCAPIVLVKKKDGTQRFCVDYRKLNEITKKDSFPLPRIDTTLDALAGSRWFSTLDMKSGYWQVDVDKSDREKNSILVGMWIVAVYRDAVWSVQRTSHIRKTDGTCIVWSTLECMSSLSR
jgi:hypothetical protein